MCTLGVDNVIYHKFSHGPFTLNGKNVNFTLESVNNVESKRKK